MICPKHCQKIPENGNMIMNDGLTTINTNHVIHLQLQREILIYLNKQSATRCWSNFAIEHTVLTLLYSYLDKLFEYFVLFYFCFHEK